MCYGSFSTRNALKLTFVYFQLYFFQGLIQRIYHWGASKLTQIFLPDMCGLQLTYCFAQPYYTWAQSPATPRLGLPSALSAAISLGMHQPTPLKTFTITSSNVVFHFFCDFYKKKLPSIKIKSFKN